MTILRDRYEVHEKLSEGGMAEVYRAVQLNLDRAVAIKFIKPELTGERFATRFAREARSIAQLRHPNILQVHDFDQAEDGRYFMVMELLEGRDLSRYIDDLNRRDQVLSWEQAVSIVRHVAAALQYAHQHDIAHRDIKPGNIFLTDDNRVIVMDFGIAKLLSSEGSLTTTGTVIGTPHYFAPEQGGGDIVDDRVDIYALGVVFFELLTGNVPYDSDSALGVLAQHASAPIPDPCAMRDDLPPDVSTIIQRAMAKNPADRYPNMRAFIDDLDALTGGEPVKTETLVLVGASQAATVPQSQPTLGIFPRLTEVVMGRARSPWRTAVLVAVIAVIALALILLVNSFSSGGDDSSQPDFDLVALGITPAAEHEYLVLVADFAGDETVGTDVARRVADTLRTDILASTLGERFRLEQIPVQITTPEEADALAEAAGALLVIWGVQDAAGLEIVVQAHGYADNTLTKLSFLVPAGESFTESLAEDVPHMVAIYSQSLTFQRLLVEDEFIALFILMTNQWDELHGKTFSTIPSTPLDRQILDVTLSLANRELETADPIITRGLGIVPNDPYLHVVRWTVNAFYLGQFERARADIEAMATLFPDIAMNTWMRTATGLLERDYAGVIAYTDTLLAANDPNAYYATSFFRELALLATGDFKTILNEINAYDSAQIDLLVSLPAMEPFRALIHELTGNEAGAAADHKTMRASRLLEDTGGVFGSASVIGANPPAVMLVYGGYITEVNGATAVAGLTYQYGLNANPNDYLLNWRRAIVYENASEFQSAFDHYSTAAGNAPVPFPIASYRRALLVHEHSAALDSPPNVCDLLIEAKTGAETDPEFYAILLEDIAILYDATGCE